MIVARTPFRISFAGGGSDLPSFYRRRYGAVVSTTIDKYMYVAIHPYFHDKIRIKYSRTEDVESVSQIQHPLVRASLQLLGVERGMEIASFADVPAGTGLGSSSSFTVCLLNALYETKGQTPWPEQLARESCHVEIDLAGTPIGKQDQYAASYGGLNYLRFNPDESVGVEPLPFTTESISELERSLLLFYVGNGRVAGEILAEQARNMDHESKYRLVEKMVNLADELRCALAGGRLSCLGEILHQGWQLKRCLAGSISNHFIDGCYDAAREAGAVGGKLLGAGGAGFLLLYCEPQHHACVRAVLRNLRELPFRFTPTGSEIIYRDGNGHALSNPARF